MSCQWMHATCYWGGHGNMIIVPCMTGGPILILFGTLGGDVYCGQCMPMLSKKMFFQFKRGSPKLPRNRGRLRFKEEGMIWPLVQEIIFGMCYKLVLLVLKFHQLNPRRMKLSPPSERHVLHKLLEELCRSIDMGGSSRLYY